MSGLWQDLRYAARMLRKSPGFTLLAVPTLALGIGASSASFTLINEAFLRPLPGVGHADRLVDLGRTQDGKGFDNLSYPNYRDLRDRNRTLSGLAGWVFEPKAVSLSENDSSERAFAEMVTWNFFDVLEAHPAAGRFFQAENEAPGSEPVAVLSHAFWKRRYHGDAGIVGSQIRINSQPVTVAGVAPEGFHGTTPVAPDLWLPMISWSLVRPDGNPLESRVSVFMLGVGRLKPGATLSQARADFSALGATLEREYPEVNQGQGFALMATGLLPGEARPLAAGFFGALLGFTGLILLIACFNVTGMFLARAEMRRKEAALRVSMGATRWRVARTLLAEGVLLSTLGGAAGLLCAVWIRDLLLAFMPEFPVPIHVGLPLDWRVVGFAWAVSLLAGMLASIVPALRISQTSPMAALKEEASSGTRRVTMRNALVAGQMAVTLLLLVCAGLFARSLGRAAQVNPGFDLTNLQVVGLDLALSGMKEEEGIAFADQLLGRVQALPGVESASLAWDLPLDGGGGGFGGIAAKETPAEGEEIDADWNVVTPGYFANMKIPLVRGRDFSDADRRGAATGAIIVNETLARRVLPGQEALGQKLFNKDGAEPARIFEVVGVARDQKYRSLGESPRSFVFVTLRQNYISRLNLAIRSTKPDATIASVRTLLRAMNPYLPVLSAQTMEEHAGLGLLPQRLAGWVTLWLGALGSLLAATGLYGVISLATLQRTREIGIRMALGALGRDVLRAVIWQGLRLALAGIAVGLVIAMAGTRLLAGLLFGISPLDPIVLGIVPFALASVAILASYLPAHRAARVDPVVALRNE
jgi:predicted permease